MQAFEIQAVALLLLLLLLLLPPPTTAATTTTATSAATRPQLRPTPQRLQVPWPVFPWPADSLCTEYCCHTTAIDSAANTQKNRLLLVVGVSALFRLIIKCCYANIWNAKSPCLTASKHLACQLCALRFGCPLFVRRLCQSIKS